MSGFIRAIRAESLKTRRSFFGWLIAGAAFFVPLIVLAARMKRSGDLPAIYARADFWERLWTITWESIAILILPMLLLLMVSLFVQIEERGNAWKQVHATPQRFAAIYLAKLTVLLLLVSRFLVLAILAMSATALIPPLLDARVPFPVASWPASMILERVLRYFVDSLPLITFQLLLALRFRTLMTPLGVGGAIWILSVGTLNTAYSHWIPYSYPALDYLFDANYRVRAQPPVAIPTLAFAISLVFAAAGYALYAARRDKG